VKLNYLFQLFCLIFVIWAVLNLVFTLNANFSPHAFGVFYIFFQNLVLR